MKNVINLNMCRAPGDTSLDIRKAYARVFRSIKSMMRMLFKQN